MGECSALGHCRRPVNLPVFHRECAESYTERRNGQPEHYDGAVTFRPDGCSCPQSCYQPSNQRLVHARTGRKCKSAANMDPGFNGDLAFGSSCTFPLLRRELPAFAPQGLRSGNPAGQHLSKREGLLPVCAGNHQTQNLPPVSYGQTRDGSCDHPRADTHPPQGSLVEAARLSAADGPLVQSAAMARLYPAVPGYRACLRRKSHPGNGQ